MRLFLLFFDVGGVVIVVSFRFVFFSCRMHDESIEIAKLNQSNVRGVNRQWNDLNAHNCGLITWITHLIPSKPSSELFIVKTGARAYALATRRLPSNTIILAQISSSIWSHLSRTSWMCSCNDKKKKNESTEAEKRKSCWTQNDRLQVEMWPHRFSIKKNLCSLQFHGLLNV